MTLYGVWNAMRQRCTNRNNKSYFDYGERGIRVCDRWMKSYKAFRTDVGARPKGMSLERRNNDLGYWCGHCEDCRSNGWPANVGWASKLIQANNTRANRFLNINGQRRTIAEWSRIYGNPPGRIWDRLSIGWSAQDAVMKPKTPER